MKHLYLLFLLFICHPFFAQNLALIDTSGARAYQTVLLKDYQSRVDAQAEGFRDEFDERRTRKEVASLYEKFTGEFTEKITDGYFVDNTEYRELFDQILARLEKSNPDYAPRLKNIKILLSYGWTPNAYSIGNGIVVVYIPLIKRLENKYELASVISHEIAHDLLHHTFNALVGRAKLNASKKFRKKTRRLKRQRFNRSAMAKTLFRDLVYDFTKFSRAKEVQADSLGFVLFRNAYKKEAYQAVNALLHFDKIDKALDSLTHQDFAHIFGTAEHPFRQDLLANNELSKYNYNQSLKFWNIDSLKTHPDSQYRAKALMTGFGVQKDSLPAVSDQFKKIKRSSRFNDILGLYVLKDYGRSLYQGFILLKTYPNNPFLQKIIYSNLLKIRAARDSYQLNKYVRRLSPELSDSYNNFLYIIRHLRRSEMDAIITKFKI